MTVLTKYPPCRIAPIILSGTLQRSLIIFFLLVLYTTGIRAQTTGDYRSVATGNWTSLATWERLNPGNNWVQPNNTQGYPGQYSVPGRIDINNDVTLNISPPNDINDLYINSGEFQLSVYDLSILGDVYNYSSLNDNNGAGTLSLYGDVYIDAAASWSAVTDISTMIRLYGDIVNNSTSVTLERCRVYSDVTISGYGEFVVEDYLEYNGSYALTNQSTVTINYHINHNGTTGALFINDEGSILNYLGGDDLLNNGTLVASAENNTVNYGGGVQEVVIPAGTDYYNLDINGNGAKTLAGSIDIGGNLIIESGTMLDITTSDYSISIDGNWTNNNATNGFTERAGTVTFNGVADQIVTRTGGETFYNIVVDKPAGEIIINSGDVTASNSLSMISGDINTGSHRVIISSNAPTSLSHTSGTIIGRLQRAISNTSADYPFPVGTGDFYRPAVFNFSTLSSAVDITAEFIGSSPGAFSSYNDGGFTVNNIFTDGYWSFVSSSVPTNNYTLELTGNGFTSYNVDGDTRISGRTDTSPSWQDFGTHGTVTSPVITRTGLSVLNTTSFDYAFATGCSASANAGPDLAICKGGSETLNASGGITYLWSPSYGLSATDIANPVASPDVTTTYTVTVTNGGCSATDEVKVTVDPEPGAVLGYAYEKTLTVDESKIPGTGNMLNYPMLVSITSSPYRDELRSVANGGNVESAGGYDIIFTDEDYHILDHQVESYDPVTGNYIAWVRIPVLSASFDTDIRLVYGNPQVTADPSVESVWDSYYQGVWHMNEDPSGSAPQLTDAARDNDGSSSGTMTGGDIVSGIINSAISFDGNDDYFDVGTGILPNVSFTEECWIRAGNQSDNSWHGFLGYDAGGDTMQRAPSLWIYEQDKIHGGFGDNVDWCEWTTPNSVITNDGTTWNHIVTTFDGVDYRLFVNGINVYSTNAWSGRIPYSSPIRYIGRVDNYFTGDIDELRLSSGVRSAEWISAQYNNYSSPSSFYSISTESSCSVFNFEPECALNPATYSIPGVAAHTYSWNVTGGTPSSTTGSSISVEWNSTGPYAIQLIETSGSCNGSSSNYTVNITDTENPTINCPVAGIQTVDTDAGDCSYGHSGTSWNASGADNCSVTSIVYTLTGATTGTGTDLDGVAFNTGTTTVTWTITDASLNTNFCSFDVEVSDDEDPAFTPASDLTPGTSDDDTGNCDVELAVPNFVFSDNCPVVTLDWDMTGAVTANGTGQIGTYAFPRGVTTVTYTITDAAGNVVTDVFTVTVTDDEDPDITCPADVTAATSDDTAGDCTTTAALGTPATSDNCSVSGVVARVGGVDIDPATYEFPIGSTTVTWIVTDGSGNSSSCTQQVTVTDDEDPAFNPPANDTICRNLDCTYNADPFITGDVYDESDNCATVIEAYVFNDDVSNLPSCDDAGYIIRTWRLEDGNGNYTDHQQIIWVEPVPQISAGDKIICDSSFTNISVSSLTTPIYGVKFVWTVTENLNVDGYSDSSPEGQALGTSIEQQLFNKTDEAQDVEYILTPWLVDDKGDLSCQGATRTVVVTIDPTPRFFPVPLDYTQCDSTDTSITLQSPSTFDSGSPVTFDYTATASGNAGDVTGFTATASGLANGHVITDFLINHTDQLQTVSYVITPVHPGSCSDGATRTVVVTINPTPQFLVTVNDTIPCDSTIINIEVTDQLGDVIGSKVYDLTTTYSPGQVEGVRADGQYPINENIVDQLINKTDQFQVVSYTLRYRLRSDQSYGYCDHGIDTTIVIYLEPTPKVTGTIVNDTLCNGDEARYTLTTVTTPVIGIEFNVEVINIYPEISGYSDRSGMDSVNNEAFENLFNSGDTARKILYVISPFTLAEDGSQKCSGIRDTIPVWINPAPRVIPVVAEDRICYGDATEVQITSPTVMTHGDLKFDYTVGFSSVEMAGDNSPQTGLNKNHLISFNYENNTDTVQSVYYYIVPRAEGTGCSAGITDTAAVKVHPLPLQDIIITNPLTCNTNSDLALEAIVARGTEPLSIHWTGAWGTDVYDTTALSGLRGGQYYVEVTDNLGCYNYDNIISTKAPPWFIVQAPYKEPYFIANTSCHETADAELQIYYWFGEDAPYTLWLVKNETDTVFEGTINTPYVPGDSSTFILLEDVGHGDYELIVMDVNGCFFNFVTTVIRPSPISAGYELSDYAGYNISCKGYNDGTISVVDVEGGNGDYRYLWYTYDGVINGDSTLDHISGIPAGTYYLQITDTLGCTRTDTITLTEPDGITLVNSVLSQSPDGLFNISCNGYNDGYIDLNFGGGSGTYNYEWFDDPAFISPIGQTTAKATELTAGSYYIYVSDINGCTMDFGFNLTEPEELEVIMDPSQTPDGKYNIDCNGGAGSIDITVNGGSPAGYLYEWWSPDGSGLDINAGDQAAVTAGKYIVRISDINGCETLDSIIMTEPPQIIIEHTVTDITCASPGMDNGSVSLDVRGGEPPYTYLWSNGSVTRDLSGLVEGRYTVTVIDDYGCQAVDTVDIALPPPLEFNKDVSDYNGFGIRCYNENNGNIDIIMSSGEEPYSYTWTGPDGYSSDEKSISQLSAGEYILTVEDNNYCTVTDTTIMTQPGKLMIDPDISESNGGGYNVNCYGDSTASIVINSENGVGRVYYYWTDGYRQAERYGLPAGTYGVLIVDDNTCSTDTVITLTQPDPIAITADITPPYCKDMPDGAISIEASGGYVVSDYNYLWYDNSTSTYIDDVAAGTYTVKVSDDNGCVVTDTIIVTSEQENCLTIPNAISPNDDNINDVWNIELIDLYPDAEIRIFNRWGELVWASENGYPEPWDGTSKGRKLPIDTYHYIINLHDGSRPAMGDITIVR